MQLQIVNCNLSGQDLVKLRTFIKNYHRDKLSQSCKYISYKIRLNPTLSMVENNQQRAFKNLLEISYTQQKSAFNCSYRKVNHLITCRL